MKIDNNINRVTSTNLDIKQVISEGGVLWKKKSLGPGPTKLIGGNEEAGFYGECPASELITGDELAKRIGLTAGTSQYSNEPWLKFSYLGKTEFIAKKTFRYYISWNHINAVNAVFGNRTIKIGDNTYKVRLLKGKTEGRQNDSSAYEGVINHNSEWNRLILPIHINAPDKWEYPDNVNSPTENWNVEYTNVDLLTSYFAKRNKGTYTWCQEYGNTINSRLLRGYFDVSCVGCNDPYTDYSDRGWRPVLELVD